MKKTLTLALLLCLALLLTGCACKHEQTELRDAIEATCTQDGYTGDTYCLDCEKVVTEGEAIPATGHTEGELTGTTDPTCVTDGYTGDILCTVCNEVLSQGEAIPATGHTEGELTGVVDATCSAYGYTGDTHCSVCGEIVARGEGTAMLPHNLSDPENVKEASCLADGYTGDQTCIDCGAVVAGEVIPKGEHSYENDTCIYCGWRTAGVYFDGELAATWQELLDYGYVKEEEIKGKLYLTYLAPNLTGELVVREGLAGCDNYPFKNCSLNAVYIPSSFTNIPSFGYSTLLEAVYLFNSPTKVREFSFNSCTSLKSITIPDSVEIIDNYAFDGCTSLTEINLPDSITGIGEYAFDNCPLSSVDLPANLKYLSRGVFDGTKITELIFPASTTSVSYMRHCNALERIDLSQTAIQTLDNGLHMDMIAGCANLKEFIMPKGLVTITVLPFSGSNAVTHLDFPDTLTTIRTSLSFKDAKSLTSIVWPVSLVDGQALTTIPNLSTIYYCGSELQWQLCGGDSLFPNVNVIFNYVRETSAE